MSLASRAPSSEQEQEDVAAAAQLLLRTPAEIVVGEPAPSPLESPGRDAAAARHARKAKEQDDAAVKKKELCPGHQCWDPDKKYKGVPLTMRASIFLSFDDPAFSLASKIYSCLMMLLILLVTTCFVLESEATLPTGFLYHTDALESFQSIELVSVCIFTVEYILRLLTCPITKKRGTLRSVLGFLFSPFNIIDALACFPFWVTFIMEAVNPDMVSSGLGFIRVIRLVRIFRVFKIGKYSTGIQMFVGASACAPRAASHSGEQAHLGRAEANHGRHARLQRRRY